MKKTKISSGLVLGLLTASLLAVCAAAGPLRAAQWTFMVYLAADNDLESASIDDFLEMSAVGSTSEVNIVVQMDRIPGYDTRYGDWKDCQRFLITAGDVPQVSSAVTDWGDGSGGREVNMADPQTLVDFVTWAASNYPAEHYALIIWNHGGGWKNLLSPQGLSKEVAWDDSSGLDEVMHSAQVQSALSSLQSQGVAIDLLGFDACLMGMLEVAYEVKDYVQVMVASEESEPDTGWPYTEILSSLVAEPNMDALGLGQEIVSDYGLTNARDLSVSQAVFDLTKLGEVTTGLDDLMTAMEDEDKLVIGIARRKSLTLSEPSYVDLYSFVQTLTSFSNSSQIQSATSSLAASLQDFVPSYYLGRALEGGRGVSIYFPLQERFFEEEYLTDIDFSDQTNWDDFLQWYYSAGTVSQITLLGPASGATLSATELPTFSWDAGDYTRFKVLFSPTEEFVRGRPTIAVPKRGWLEGASTAQIAQSQWEVDWQVICDLAQENNGTVYWKVIGRDEKGTGLGESEIRSFVVE